MKKTSLFLLDILLLYFSLVLTLLIRYGDRFAVQYDIHLTPFGFIFGLWILVFYIANLYEAKILRNTAYFYSSLIQSISIAGVISIVSFYLIPVLGITPKTNLFIFILIFTGLETLGRTVFNNVVGKKFKKPTLVVGINEQSLQLVKYITDNPQLGYDLKYIVNTSGQNITLNQKMESLEIVQNPQELESIINSGKIDTVIIGPEAYQIPEIIEVFYKSLEHKITFYSLSLIYERLTGQVPLGTINQIWFLENLSEGARKSYEIIKRIADIIFGIIIGLISLIFYPFVIAGIKLISPGPIFYRQKRIGQHGKPFEIIKFRTMVEDAERGTGAVWAADKDPRITKIGSFLRKARIDELPQIWNIIKGDMSFVGPRAERPEFHELLKKNIPFYEERYLIKPGLSGWAQINYPYGSSIDDSTEKLKYDLYYIKNRSLTLDLGVVLKTLRIVLSQAGK